MTMFKPLNDRVLIQPIEHKSETSYGLILASGVTNEGRIVAVGLAVKDLQIGDVVRFANATKLETYMLCREADVMCVVLDDTRRRPLLMDLL